MRLRQHNRTRPPDQAFFPSVPPREFLWPIFDYGKSLGDQWGLSGTLTVDAQFASFHWHSRSWRTLSPHVLKEILPPVDSFLSQLFAERLFGVFRGCCLPGWHLFRDEGDCGRMSLQGWWLGWATVLLCCHWVSSHGRVTYSCESPCAPGRKGSHNNTFLSGRSQSLLFSSTVLSSIAATSHRWLLRFKLIRIKSKENFSSSVHEPHFKLSKLRAPGGSVLGSVDGDRLHHREGCKGQHRYILLTTKGWKGAHGEGIRVPLDTVPCGWGHTW